MGTTLLRLALTVSLGAMAVAASIAGAQTIPGDTAAPAPTPQPGPTSPDQTPMADGASGQDVIVTATKRGENLRDIAGSVSAVTSEDLARLNAQSLSDYITRVPGVNFNDYQPGVSEVTIRGVASTTYHEANQATTGYYLNDIPLIEPTFPLVIPDIDSFDVSRVEVLRGPQGTLFGSSSLGGAINYVVNLADPTRIEAAGEGMIALTQHAGEPNYAGKAMINVPIVTDKLAVRVVALQRYDAGYLDNIGTKTPGSDDLRVRGLRGSLVWTPTDTTRITALSMVQEYNLADQTYALFSLARFQRSTNVPEYQNTSVQLHSLRLDQELGFATLTALGSYVRKTSHLAFDDSIFLGYDARTGTPELSATNGHSETGYGEIRLASSGKHDFNWLIGANYTKLTASETDSEYLEGIGDYITANPGQFGGQSAATIAPGDQFERTASSNRVEELALFGEASYTFRNVLTLTAGGRVFHYNSEPRLQFLPNAAGIATFDYQPGTKRDTGFIPKVSLKYQPGRFFMAYALYSEGFRIGGVNVYSRVANTPLTFGSDRTRNYEVGTRFDIVPNRFSVDVSAYHINWDNIQARLFTPVTFDAYTTNGGGAKIDGVELTVTQRPAWFLTFTNNISYNNARLSSLLPDSSAPGGGYGAGSRLPGASPWTVSNQIDLLLSRSSLRPRINIANRYLAKSPVAFGATLQRGGYDILDVNAAITVARRFEVGAFVKNVANSYGIVDAPFSFAGSVVRPRTIGGTLRFNFE